MANTLREVVYDAEIAPLVLKIHAICKEKNIPFVASFDISDEKHKDFRCTSASSRRHLPELFEHVLDLLLDRMSFARPDKRG